MRSSIAGLLGVLCLVVAVEAEAQSHLIIGTWFMNTDKTLLVTDNVETLLIDGFAGRSGCFEDNPRVCTRVDSFEELEDGSILYTAATVSPEGQPGFHQAVFMLGDGNAYPYYQEGELEALIATGTASNLSATWTQVDDYTIQAVLERDGQPEGERSWTVSTDGNTMSFELFVFDRIDGRSSAGN